MKVALGVLGVLVALALAARWLRLDARHLTAAERWKDGKH